jgi:acyl-ACP thioesterase
MDDATATVDYRIRFDEAGPAGWAKPSLFLRLAQDVAWIHSERLGFTRAWYGERGLAWLVRGVSLEVTGRAGHGETVAATTRVVGYRRIWARRAAALVVAGAPVATVLTDWILTDREGRPARVPDEIVARLRASDSTIQAIRVPATPDREADVSIEAEIRRSELDPLAHVNNAAYLDRALDLGLRAAGLGTSAAVDRPTVAIEYRAAAGPRDRVTESAWRLAAGTGFAYEMRATDRTIVRARATFPPR